MLSHTNPQIFDDSVLEKISFDLWPRARSTYHCHLIGFLPSNSLKLTSFNFDMTNTTILAALKRKKIIIFGCRKPGFLTPIFSIK